MLLLSIRLPQKSSCTKSGFFPILETRKNLGRVSFRKDFWGQADQLLANFLSVPSTVPEDFAKVNSAQFPLNF